MERWSRGALVAVGAAWLVLVAVPFALLPTDQRTLARVLILGLLAMSLNILVGNTGIVSFGQGLFYGAGAYTVSLLWLHQGISAMVALALSPFVGAGLAALGGLVAFRATKLYFGLLTLALSQFGFVLANQWYGLTQGENGIYGVEMPSWLGDTSAKYWFILGVVSVCLVAIRILIASPFGTTLRAIRDNRERVAFLGLSPIRYEYTAYVIAGGFAGVAGALLVILDQNSFPVIFNWTTSAEPLLMIVIGGSAYFFGPLLGALVVVYLQDFLQDVTTHINLVYGLIVLIIAIGAPGGLSGMARTLVRRVRGRGPRSARDPQPSEAATPYGADLTPVSSERPDRLQEKGKPR